MPICTAKPRVKKSSRINARTQEPFHFVTITNPNQSKAQLKSIRSHVMMNFLQKKDAATLSHGESSSKVEGQPSEIELQSSRQPAPSRSTLEIGTHPCSVTPGHQMVIAAGRPKAVSQGLSRYYTAHLQLARQGLLSSKGHAEKKFVEEVKEACRLVEALLLSGTEPGMIIDGGIDTFLAMPQLGRSGINIARLKMHTAHAFSSKGMNIYWMPTLIKHRLSFLSGIILGAVHFDTVNGLVGESAITIAVKIQVMNMLSEALSDPERAKHDVTMMTVAHLALSEVIRGDEWTISTHTKGLRELVFTNGGLSNIGMNGVLAVTACLAVYFSAGFRERLPWKEYMDYIPVNPRLIRRDPSKTIVESPLYCPRDDFFTVLRSKRCTPAIYELICDARDMTNLFVEPNEDSYDGHTAPFCRSTSYENVKSSTAHEYPESNQQYNRRSHETRLMTIYDLHTRILSAKAAAHNLPPGTRPDMVYEAIRLTAVLYSYAIVNKVPLSVASRTATDPATGPDAPRSTPPPIIGADGITRDAPRGPRRQPNLAMRIREALEASGTSDFWGDMAGVLLWCVSVGAVASNPARNFNCSSSARPSDAATTMGMDTPQPFTSSTDERFDIPSNSAAMSNVGFGSIGPLLSFSQRPSDDMIRDYFNSDGQIGTSTPPISSSTITPAFSSPYPFSPGHSDFIFPRSTLSSACLGPNPVVTCSDAYSYPSHPDTFSALDADPRSSTFDLSAAPSFDPIPGIFPATQSGSYSSTLDLWSQAPGIRDVPIDNLQEDRARRWFSMMTIRVVIQCGFGEKAEYMSAAWRKLLEVLKVIGSQPLDD
ncbi:hypothetical protein P152DRAFT_80128 [Eremomyces bilateralis CBS 781.70]|uniref:Transcription factor domain-containing protein n=1 Tax=Eremomyces bilateralis CBS 781.70 TaxID=1392243 RepID=A0A6G1FZY5_9PEZI|nr:uncharacterized protein P152DRAFT_80128 [Eremomyces bilateralis CBS 781.70]KAF1811129.1 hypothetical protein P152DRAFT_80128 [Eremomyces bilateralis CBS 781.70]